MNLPDNLSPPFDDGGIPIKQRSDRLFKPMSAAEAAEVDAGPRTLISADAEGSTVFRDANPQPPLLEALQLLRSITTHIHIIEEKLNDVVAFLDGRAKKRAGK